MNSCTCSCSPPPSHPRPPPGEPTDPHRSGRHICWNNISQECFQQTLCMHRQMLSLNPSPQGPKGHQSIFFQGVDFTVFKAATGRNVRCNTSLTNVENSRSKVIEKWTKCMTRMRKGVLLMSQIMLRKECWKLMLRKEFARRSSYAEKKKCSNMMLRKECSNSMPRTECL